MSHTRREVQLPSTQISYLEWMPSTAPRRTVVLLHGAGIDCAQLAWGHLGSELAAAGHRVLAPDLPGFGETTPADSKATQANLVACIAQFIDELQLVDVTLGGISMGGGISLGYGL